MRFILLALALFPFNSPYAAPVLRDGVPLEGAGPPWSILVEQDEHLPDRVFIGGRPLLDITVDPTGLLILNDTGFDSSAPRALGDLAMSSVVAPFWALLETGACPDGSAAGAVTRTNTPTGVRFAWLDVPVRGCPQGGGLATFSVELSIDGEGALRAIELRYEALPSETLVIEPRAGVSLRDRGESIALLELFPDSADGVQRGRAKLLQEGSSDGEAGAWIIDLGPQGHVVGEREPEELDDDGQPRRPDGWRESDNCPVHFNPLQENMDGDRWGDVCDGERDGDLVDNDADNCPWTPNRDQADLDGDGHGDACDPDRDGDGWPDVFDRCPAVADSANQDLDRDRLGDACDPDPDADDPWALALRRFGADRCPLVFDPLRLDRDHDGLGDACDLLPEVRCVDDCHAQADSDGDRISDVVDTCPMAYDPRQLDTDGDGRGNACDPDANGDGVIDGFQACELGLCRDLSEVTRLSVGGWGLR